MQLHGHGHEHVCMVDWVEGNTFGELILWGGWGGAQGLVSPLKGGDLKVLKVGGACTHEGGEVEGGGSG